MKLATDEKLLKNYSFGGDEIVVTTYRLFQRRFVFDDNNANDLIITTKIENLTGHIEYGNSLSIATSISKFRAFLSNLLVFIGFTVLLVYFLGSYVNLDYSTQPVLLGGIGALVLGFIVRLFKTRKSQTFIRIYAKDNHSFTLSESKKVKGINYYDKIIKELPALIIDIQKLGGMQVYKTLYPEQKEFSGQ
ncbi:MAG: hypothetical protein FWD32_01945 [Firmicutes bacterium]|nr:hypothetical protein [Bacillota bacterium]